MSGIRFSPHATISVFSYLLVVIHGFSVRYRITEEKNGGLFIGDLVKDSNLQVNGRKVTFSFVQLSLFYRNIFSLDKVSGNLYAKGDIDREIACAAPRKCPLKFDVAAKFDNRFVELITVTIDIIDINDNSPTFYPNITYLNIKENNNINEKLRFPAAIDRDFNPRYQIKSYRLYNNFQGLFSLNRVRNLEGSDELEITVHQSLDREKTPQGYRLVVIAEDGDNPPRSGSATVDISVDDDNDHFPVFVESLYHKTIKENIRPGSVITSVRAVDEDINENGHVFYRFSYQTRQRYSSRFSLNQTSGFISVVGEIDYEKQPLYQLTVIASDMGIPAKSTSANVMVKVLDINDNDPEIHFDFLSGQNHASVQEDATNGSFVGHISTVDKDSGGSQNVLCVILNKVPFSLKGLGNNKYMIVVAGALDRETKPEYNLTIICHDTGEPSRSSRKLLTIRIMDVNDNSPKFDQSLYKAIIPENYKRHVTIIRVYAADNDTGINSDIVYSIDANVTSLLKIDPSFGVISAISALDREKTPLIEFEVYATDKGHNPKNSTSKCQIWLSDINDNAPKFMRNLYSFTINENSPTDSYVGTVNATDEDLSSGGLFYYEVVDRTYSFNVKSNGNLTSLRSFDREKKDLYRFIVIAIDYGDPSLTGSTLIEVKIIDVNDNYPVFVFPNSTSFIAKIPYSLKSGDTVANVSAVDADVGVNGELTYSMFSVGSEDYDYMFGINHNTGKITLKIDLNFRHKKLYVMELKVADKGQPRKSQYHKLHISVHEPDDTKAKKQDALSKNAIIIIVIVSVTVVLINIIIAAICILRRKYYRKNRTSSDELMSNSQFSSEKLSSEPSQTMVYFSKSNSNSKNGKELTVCVPPSEFQQIPSSGDSTSSQDSGHGQSDVDTTSNNESRNYLTEKDRSSTSRKSQNKLNGANISNKQKSIDLIQAYPTSTSETNRVDEYERPQPEKRAEIRPHYRRPKLTSYSDLERNFNNQSNNVQPKPNHLSNFGYNHGDTYLNNVKNVRNPVNGFISINNDALMNEGPIPRPRHFVNFNHNNGFSFHRNTTDYDDEDGTTTSGSYTISHDVDDNRSDVV